MTPFSTATEWELAEQLRLAVADVFQTEDVTFGSGGPPLHHGAIRLRGHLRVDSHKAYALISERFRRLGFTALLRKDGDGEAIVAAPGTAWGRASSRPWVPALLLVLTLASVIYIGALMDPAPDGHIRLWNGFPFAVSLIAILGAHELGHYFAARHVGTPVTLPYFIPMPVPPFGTMGAFIQMKGPSRDRRALLTIAVAGPLAGLVVAIPVLILGLSLSHVEPLPARGYIMEGNSLLYAALKILLFGRLLPSEGLDVFLHPVAFAGWAGLLVTGLNLIPAGQLDGGHIVYALLGTRSRALTLAIILALLGLAWLWNGWLLWAFLVFLFSRTQATPLDDVTQLTAAQRLLAIGMMLLFILIFVPVPLTVHP